ncbi:hypothetical protein ACT3UJ_12585 [Halomonas sp. 86]|uniref:hypothetical protein n=1 Tax=unclassified Halomonas TaxID=2609666 RepID=UPI004034CE0F
MNMPNSAMGRLLNIKTIGSRTVSQVISDMDEIAAGQVSSVFADNDNNVFGALVIINRPDTQRYLDAIQAVTDQIDNEDQE